MPVDAFVALAEPTRRRILDHLRRGDSSVNELVDTLAMRQPTVSKHLKVLRQAGFVSVRIAAQQRIYRIEVTPFTALDAWLEPYRRLWATHLDALERHLDSVQVDSVQFGSVQPGSVQAESVQFGSVQPESSQEEQ